MKLIYKDVLVAEIEKLKKSHDNWSYMGKCFHQEYETLLSFINTIGVKEVDLNEEIANEYESNYEEYLTYEEFADIAKHFFELGLRAQKGE